MWSEPLITKGEEAAVTSEDILRGPGRVLPRLLVRSRGLARTNLGDATFPTKSRSAAHQPFELRARFGDESWPGNPSEGESLQNDSSWAGG